MQLSKTIEYEDGEFVVLEGGQTDRTIFIVLEGQARVLRETEKGQVTLALLEEGDIFGEVSFLAQKYGRRSASVVAKGNLKVGILDNERLTGEYNKLSPTFQKLLRDVSERFSKTTSLTVQLAADRMKKPTLELRDSKRRSLESYRIKVDYTSEKHPERRTFGSQESYQGVLLDLATAGMGLELFTSTFSKSSHPLGGKFVFQFTLPEKPMIKVPGRIVWLRELGSKRARMGVKFTETNPYLQKIVKEFLQEISSG